MSSPVVAEAVGTPHPQFCAKSVPFGQGSQVILVSPNLRVELLTQGAAVNSVRVRKTATWDAPSSDTDEWIEVCLGYTDASECEEPDNLTGVVCGRFAGRIGDGRFSLNGSEYSTLQNCGKHTLHGGPMGFSRLPWRFLITEGEEEIGVAFHLTSAHLDQGFPGELHVTATYAIPKTTQRAPQLRLNLQAHLSDSTPVNATVVNLANHTYWNLNGVPRAARVTDVCPLPAPITNHCLKLQSIYTLELDADLIPTGGMVPTEGTYHDYQRMRCLEAGMMDGAEDGRGEGYDNPMALETWDHTLREALVLYSPQTKLQMSIQTTNPAVVVYTANGLPATANGARGQRFQKFGAVCMECQYFPNSPNVEAFPSTTLSKGETYSEITVHEFKFSASLPHDVE